MMTKNITDPELSGLMNEVQSLKERFLVVEESLGALKNKAKATMAELSRTEQEFTVLVEERHTLALRCRGWVLRHHTEEPFAELDDLFNLQEKLIDEIGAAHVAILKRTVYSKMGYPS